MNLQEPVLITIVLDAEDDGSSESLLAEIEFRGSRLRPCRLSDHRSGGIQDGAQINWAQQADAVASLVEEACQIRPKDGSPAALYICGQGPLPLFVQLGFELSSWREPITFVCRRADGTLAFIPVTALSPAETSQRSFFRIAIGPEPDKVAQDDYEPLSLFLSNRGYDADAAAIFRFLESQGEKAGAMVEVCTRGFCRLENANAAQATSELRSILEQTLQRCTGRTLAVFVDGEPALSVLLGRELGFAAPRQRCLIPRFREHMYEPALVLPWPRRSSQVDNLEPIIIFLADADPPQGRALVREALRRQLEIPRNDVVLHIWHPHMVEPGIDKVTETRRMLAHCDIIVALLSPEFICTEIAKVVEQELEGSRRVFPILESSIGLEGTAWEKVQILPDQNRPLRRSSHRDEVLADIAVDIWRLACEITANRRALRERAWASPVVGSHERTGTARPICAALDTIEDELRSLPKIRSTFARRKYVWERLIEDLARIHPEQHLREKLYASSRAEWEQFQRFHRETKEPAFFRPDDSLGAVLCLLDADAAARWLFLGAVEVAPRFHFLHGGQSRHEDLAARLSSYESYLTDNQQWQLKQSLFLHNLDCPSLLAVLPLDRKVPEAELRLASQVLSEFRLGARVEDIWRGHRPEELSSAAVLNILGAEATWRTDFVAAERAYKLAQERAQHDQLNLAEWVAVSGLILVYEWRRGIWASSADERDAAASGIRIWTNRRRELEQDPHVRALRDYETVTLLGASRDVADALQRVRVGGRGQPRLPQNLEILLKDQEELGESPMVRGETVEAIGSGYLLQTQVPAPMLRSTIAVLCCYGAYADESWRFFSAALHPLADGFQDICSDVLKPGRTLGEWMARFSFLHRFLSDISPALKERVCSFYNAALNTFAHSISKSMLRLTGRSFGESQGWVFTSQVIGQTLELASFLPDGINLIQQLFESPSVHYWQGALEGLHRPPWKEWHSLGMLTPLPLERLARCLLEKLALPESKCLIELEHKRSNGFWRNENIPLGLAKVLSVMQKAEVSPSVVEQLHLYLRSMLALGMERNRSSFQRIFFTDDVLDCLANYSDNSRHFQEREIDKHLECLTKYDTISTYCDGLSMLSEQAQRLLPSQWEKLGTIVLCHRDALLTQIGSLDYSVRPLLWLASALLGREQPELREMGQELFRQSLPLPAGLLSAVTASPERLGSLAETLEHAVLHCLRGLADVPMPWFSSPKSPWQHDGDELVRVGLGAVHNRIHAHPRTPPSGGWQRWLEPCLAHCYSANPRVAERAVDVLERALHHNIDGLSISGAVQALCWALSRPHQAVRDQALYIAVRHRQRLAAIDSAIDSALARFTPPRSISVDWIMRVASLPMPPSR